MATSPEEHVDQLICAYWGSQCVYVAAKLGIADLLAGGPLSIEELAQRTVTHAPTLFRVMRALASLGVFAEESGKRFRLTPAAETLRSGVANSKQALAILFGEDYFRSWGELLFSVRTGKPSFDEIYGQPLFEFLSQRPEKAAVFDRAMISAHGRQADAMLDAYDFSHFGSIADIGGGNGWTLSSILKRHPGVRGTLFDLAGVVERARGFVEKEGVLDRVQFVDGDFFQSVPAGTDAYILRHIIHDWDEEKSTRILQNVRRAIKLDGRVLIVETVVPPGNGPSFAKLLDLTMLVVPGGQERTAVEYSELLGRCGFELTRIVPTSTEDSVIEGVPR